MLNSLNLSYVRYFSKSRDNYQLNSIFILHTYTMTLQIEKFSYFDMHLQVLFCDLQRIPATYCAS